MPTQVGPRRLQKAAHEGFKRLSNFRRARLMFIRNYVGQYYDQERGDIGQEPLNLIFNAIRVLVPTLVSNFPKHNVSTGILPYREYAELLSLALDFNSKQVDIREVYRRWIVDAIFTMGILKTGLASSGSLVSFGDDIDIDPGEIYTKNVDFDNFVFDPTIRGDMSEAAFMGDRVIVSRRELLDSGQYRNEFVEQLAAIDARPNANNEDTKRVSELSRRNVTSDAFLEQQVEVLELWVPGANAIVTVPGGRNQVFTDYLRVADYAGDPNGPYTLLSFTPPVPNNPLPVSMVGIWNDLHVLANKMATKVISQADRQKNVITYKPSAADDAAELRDAADGEAVAVEDPDAVKVHSFGGQAQSNDIHLAQLQGWFNMMAANPQAVGGQDLRADSATEADILNTNATVGLNDMKDLVYIAGAKEARKRAWYMHTDPLIQLPLVRRQPVVTPFGVQQVEAQVFLTPEARRGDLFDYALEFQQDSMQRVDQNVRLQRATDFGVRIMPTAINAAVQAFQIGMPFNLPAYLRRMAENAGIEWLDEVFFDPSFQQRMEMMLLGGPQFQNSTGQLGPAGANVDRGVLQNGQPGTAGAGPTSAQTDFLSQAQSGAANSQRLLQGVFSPGTS